MDTNLIPTIDLLNFHHNKDAMLKSVSDACKTTGILFLQKTGMNSDVLVKAKESFKEFFTEFPLEKRIAHHYFSPFSGYSNKGFLENGNFYVNYKEQYFDVHHQGMAMVRERPQFKKNINSLRDEFQVVAVSILKRIAQTLGEAPDYFEDQKSRGGCSVLRAIHCTPVINDEITINARIKAALTDSVITIISLKDVALEVFLDGVWVSAAIPDTNILIVTVGGVLERITNRQYKSGSFRMTFTPGKEVLCTLFSYYMQNDFKITPLPQFGLQKKEEY